MTNEKAKAFIERLGPGGTRELAQDERKPAVSRRASKSRETVGSRSLLTSEIGGMPPTDTEVRYKMVFDFNERARQHATDEVR
jgi:hypothetical protein